MFAALLRSYALISPCAVAGELCTECWDGCGYIRWIQQESIRLPHQPPCVCCLAAPVWVSVQGYCCRWALYFNGNDFMLLSLVLSGTQL